MTVALRPAVPPAAISLARTSLALLPVQVCLRAAEALLPLLLAAWYGRSVATDVFYLAWALGAVAASVVVGLFRDSALIPILVREESERRDTLDAVRGAVLGHALVMGGALGVAVAAGGVVWLGPRWPGGRAAFALWLALPFSGYVVLQGARSFLEAVVQAEGRFVRATLGGAVGMSLAVAILALSRGRGGIAVVPLALLAAEAASVLVLARYALERLPAPSLRRLPAVREFGRRALAEAAGGALTRLNPLLDQAMAAALAVTGGGTLLRLSGDVAGVLASLLQATLLPVLLGRLSRDMVGRRVGSDQHRRTVIGTMLVTAGLLGALATLLGLGRRPILTLAFQHGAMDAAGVAELAALLPYHLVGVVPFGLLLILARAHVSLGNSRIMFRMGILNCLCNLGFNFVLRSVLGLRGLALSTSLVSAVVAGVFWVSLTRVYARTGVAAAKLREAA